MELTNTNLTNLGIKHGYINDVLKEKNLGVLPCTVNNSGYSVAKQRMLIKIKKEQQDSTASRTRRLSSPQRADCGSGSAAVGGGR